MKYQTAMVTASVLTMASSSSLATLKLSVNSAEFRSSSRTTIGIVASSRPARSEHSVIDLGPEASLSDNSQLLKEAMARLGAKPDVELSSEMSEEDLDTILGSAESWGIDADPMP